MDKKENMEKVCRAVPAQEGHQRKTLEEINLLRPVVVLLIVVLHSFTMYMGGWPLPEGIERNFLYLAIAKFSYSCVLEMFTFMSGYLLAYGRIDRGKQWGFRELFVKKFQRLMLPAAVFGVLYLLVVEGTAPALSWAYWYGIAEGVAHLWFLPMLFWCFLFTGGLLRLPLGSTSLLALLLLLALFPIGEAPLQLDKTAYYLAFFYLGYWFRERHSRLAAQASLARVVRAVSGFLFAFVVLSVLGEQAAKQAAVTEGMLKEGLMVAERCCRVVYSLSGIYAGYLAAVYLTSRYRLPLWWSNSNRYCFAVYLIHHFILPILYYKTALPALLGSYLLPWVGLSVTLVLSLVLSVALLRTRIGRWLAG